MRQAEQSSSLAKLRENYLSDQFRLRIKRKHFFGKRITSKVPKTKYFNLNFNFNLKERIRTDYFSLKLRRKHLTYDGQGCIMSLRREGIQ